MTNLRTATYRKPRAIRTVTLETGGYAPYTVVVRKGTGRTCWAGSGDTLTEAVAEFHRAIEWVRSQGLMASMDDIAEAHTLAVMEDLDRTIAAHAAAILDEAHVEALEEERRMEDAWLESLSISQAATFEATGELPEGLRPHVHDMIRRAHARREACPWTNVVDVSGDVRREGPCKRWAGHPGGCVLADLATPTSPSVQAHFGGWTSGAMTSVPPKGTESVPPGGFPSPYAVAVMVEMAQEGRVLAWDSNLHALAELEERGHAVREIPGRGRFVLTEAGGEFARRWILSGV